MGSVWEGEQGRVCRIKRDEERIAREMAEKEEEEARAVLEQAAKSGKIKLPTTGDKLDKEAILNQVTSASPMQTYLRRIDLRECHSTAHLAALPNLCQWGFDHGVVVISRRWQLPPLVRQPGTISHHSLKDQYMAGKLKRTYHKQ
jgi:hypothetical protein